MLLRPAVLVPVVLSCGAASGQIPGLACADDDPFDAGETRWYLNLDDTLPFESNGAPRWSSKTIGEGLTLPAQSYPYVICEGTLNVTSGATLTNNGEHGLYVQDGWTAPPIEYVTMTGNRIPCRLRFSMLSPKRMTEGDTNVYSPNEIDVIEIAGNYPVDTLDYEIPFDIKHGAGRDAIPVTTYHVVDNDLYVPDGYTLEVDPGVVVKGASQYRLNIYGGRLEAVGTEDDPIYFTSYRDDSVGNTAYGETWDSGDTNDDGPSVGAPGDWAGIDAWGTASVRLEHVCVRYADDNLNLGVSSGLGLVAEIRSSTFEDALDDGLYLSGGSGDTIVLEGCRIRDNGGDSGPYDPSDDTGSGGDYNPGGAGDLPPVGAQYPQHDLGRSRAVGDDVRRAVEHLAGLRVVIAACVESRSVRMASFSPLSAVDVSVAPPWGRG